MPQLPPGAPVISPYTARHQLEFHLRLWSRYRVVFNLNLSYLWSKTLLPLWHCQALKSPKFGFLLKGGGVVESESKPFEELFTGFFSLSLNIFKER